MSRDRRTATKPAAYQSGGASGAVARRDRGGAAAALSRVLRRNGRDSRPPKWRRQHRDFDDFDEVLRSPSGDRSRASAKARPAWSAPIGCSSAKTRASSASIPPANTTSPRSLRFPGRVLELGRSCVDAGYRTKAVMQLLWQGIAGYVLPRKIDLMFGCASLPGSSGGRNARADLLASLVPPDERSMPQLHRRLDPSANRVRRRERSHRGGADDEAFPSPA